MFQPPWVCPRSRRVCSPHLHCSGSRLLSRERALSCVDFPGPSRSGSGFQVLHKGADSVGSAFCAFPRRSSSSNKELEERTLSPPRPCLSFRAHPVHAPCVSSGELISSCDHPGRCQPSRISGSLWLETGSLFGV